MMPQQNLPTYNQMQKVSTQLLKRQSSLDLLGQDELRKRIKLEEGESHRTFYIINFKIYIFTESRDYANLIMVLTDIAEPLSKPAHINQFQISRTSLLRAKALGYTYHRITDFILRHTKNPPIGQELEKLIASVMNSQVVTRLYLIEEKDRNYYVFEANRQMQLPPQINDLLVKQIEQQKKEAMTECKQEQSKIARWLVRDYCHNQLSSRLFAKEIPVLSDKIIDKTQIQQQMHRNVDIFKNKGALHCKNLKIDLKAFTKLREYQSQALKTVVLEPKKGERAAKSGYIVLPCGAGKTLLGIAICSKIKKETLIVCSSDSGAQQWKRQIQKWTQGLSKQQIVILTAKSIQDYKFNVRESKPHIFISTYSNLKSKLESREREGEVRREVKVQHEWMRLMPWGLIIFDQAQWLPAPGNSLIANSLLAHVKIGLTATPLREDENIKSLIFMIGPQLYVGSWRKFVQLGYLANPKCLEVRTKLTKDFQKLYQQSLQTKSRENKEKEGLYQCNPNKIKALMYLLQHHEKLNDHIIVFCDRISIINFLAQKLKIPLLSGRTSTEDRNFVFDMFREGYYKTVLLSRIGDEAIDLPNANVAIEINIHKGSRRQMLQRLGRIMRPKQASSSQSYNAIFYTIVTDGTIEMAYFRKRRECLVNLGFQYDLRFCEYGDQNVPDILRDDEDCCESIRSKLRKVIPDEIQFWNQMKNQKELEE